MKSSMLFVLLLLSLSASAASGQKVQLLKTGVAGYQYSLNGTDFVKIGPRGSGLAIVMQDDSLASRHLSQYHSGRSAGRLTGLIGIGLMSYGGFMTAAEMEDGGINPLLFVGAAFGVAGVIQILAANRHLTRSVRTFNENVERADSINFNDRTRRMGTANIGLYFSFRF